MSACSHGINKMFFPKTFNRGCVVSGREWEGQFRVVPVPGGPNLERAADHHYRPLLHIIAFAAGLMDCAAITSRLKHLISIRDYHISQMSQAHITQTTSILFLCAILNSHHGCSSLYNERWYLRHLTFNFLPVSLCRLILRCIYYTISIIYIHTTMRRVCRNCNCCELNAICVFFITGAFTGWGSVCIGIIGYNICSTGFSDLGGTFTAGKVLYIFHLMSHVRVHRQVGNGKRLRFLTKSSPE